MSSSIGSTQRPSVRSPRHSSQPSQADEGSSSLEDCVEQTFEILFREAYEATLGKGMSYDEVIKGKAVEDI